MPDGFMEGVVRRCLPIAKWPEPDRNAWAAAHRRGGLLDQDGQARRREVKAFSGCGNGRGGAQQSLLAVSATE